MRFSLALQFESEARKVDMSEWSQAVAAKMEKKREDERIANERALLGHKLSSQGREKYFLEIGRSLREIALETALNAIVIRLQADEPEGK